jgi:hypothetical protein
MVMPSAERATTWSAPGSMPISRSNGASGTPSQRAVPMYGPPTSLETQLRVMSRSIRGRLSRSVKDSSVSLPTMP